MREATRDAVRFMIEYLGVERGLNRADAYMLCSVAADLRLHEVVRSVTRLARSLLFIYWWKSCLQVDMPNYVVRLSAHFVVLLV